MILKIEKTILIYILYIIMIWAHKDINNITAIVATHNRSNALKKLIKSLSNHYPKIPLIVIDSSTDKVIQLTKQHLIVDSNTWISWQRNIALDLVQTDLLLLLDDDYIFSYKTNINIFIKDIINNWYHIIWGQVNNLDSQNFNFHGIYHIHQDVLYHFIDHWYNKENKKYDTIFNFFLWETNIIKSIWWWDEKLKYAREHDDFFLNAKNKNLNVWYNDNISIDHKSYKKYHWWKKAEESIKYFLQKWGITNKIEIRLIQNNNPDLTYISYHNCIKKEDLIPKDILSMIHEKYGNFTIKIS